MYCLCYRPYLVSMLFADLLSLQLVTFLMFFICSCHFFSGRCMLELMFAIYYKVASLPSQASYAVLADESFKHSPPPTVFLISHLE